MRQILNLANSQKVDRPFGKECILWKMSSTSIHRAMEFLILKDYVFVESGIYKVLDPLFKSVLSS